MTHLFPIPVPNLNGDQKATLTDQYLDSKNAIVNAIETITKEIECHGRNFQTVEDGMIKRQLNVDLKRKWIRSLELIQGDLYSIAKAINRDEREAKLSSWEIRELG